jgi:hypothetical protein
MRKLERIDGKLFEKFKQNEVASLSKIIGGDKMSTCTKDNCQDWGDYTSCGQIGNSTLWCADNVTTTKDDCQKGIFVMNDTKDLLLEVGVFSDSGDAKFF